MNNDSKMWLIKKIVATHFGLTIEDMKRKSRKPEICNPRQIAQVLCSEVLKVSNKQIAKEYGMCRTTIYSSLEVVSNRNETEHVHRKDYNKLEKISINAIEKLNKFHQVKEAVK